jgi:hypothetical protein
MTINLFSLGFAIWCCSCGANGAHGGCEMLTAWMLGAGIGVVSEISARTLRLWLYRKPVYPVINVVVMFGITMGSLSLLATRWGLAAAFAAGTAVGFAYEWLNFLALDWWYFPDDRFLVFRGRAAMAASVAVIWGAVPVMIAVLKPLVAV